MFGLHKMVWNIYPAFTFLPVVENCNKKGAFLCNYPSLVFNQKSHVPVLMGMNSGEGGIFAARMYDSSNTFVDIQLQKNFNEYASTLLGYKYTTKLSDLPFVGKKIYDHYFPEKNMDPSNVVKMISGGLFVHGIINMAFSLSSPVYYYIYDYQNSFSFNRFFGPYTEKLGVTHGDELTSLFYRDGQVPLKDKDHEVSILMIDIWTSFAKCDDRRKMTINGSFIGELWPDFKIRDMKYVLINSNVPFISEKPFIDEHKFWNSLPLFNIQNTIKKN